MSSSEVDPAGAGPALTEAEIALLRRRAERARKLTQAPDDHLAEIVAFERRGATYALRLSSLREIRPLEAFCSIPAAGDTVPGIAAYRGEVLSLHDIAAFLGRATQGSEGRWMLVVEHGAERLGLLADELVTVEPISERQIQPVPLSLGELATCFEGVVQGKTLLLDLAQLFANPHFYRAMHA